MAYLFADFRPLLFLPYLLDDLAIISFLNIYKPFKSILPHFHRYVRNS